MADDQLNDALALISMADGKSFLKIPVATTTEDDIVCQIINHCSAWINKYCDRVFLTGDYTEDYDGCSESGVLQLRHFPVTAVTSVKEDTLHVFGATTLIASSDYYLTGDVGEISLYNQRAYFLEGVRSVRVAYTAGYALASMPEDIKMAARVLVSYVYRNMYSQWRVGVASETIGQKTTTFAQTSMPKEVVEILKPYRNLKAGY